MSLIFRRTYTHVLHSSASGPDQRRMVLFRAVSLPTSQGLPRKPADELQPETRLDNHAGNIIHTQPNTPFLPDSPSVSLLPHLTF